MICDDRIEADSPFFDLLPDEVILEILEHLTLPEMALGLWPLGNKRLRGICRDPKFCTRVDVEGCWDADVARKVLTMVSGPHLEELGLGDRDGDFHALSLLALESCPNLEWLKCNDEIPSSVLLSAIGKSDSPVRKINLLGLFHDTFNARGERPVYSQFDAYDALARNMSNLKNLTWISIGPQPWPFRPDFVTAIADNCDRLEHLDLPGPLEMSDETFNYFLDRVRGTLKHLALRLLQHLTDASFGNLRNCKFLEELKLDSAHAIGADGIKAIGSLPKLRRLQMSESCSNLTARDYTEAFGRGGGRRDKMSAMRNLISLQMIECELDDTCIEVMAESCPNLEHLELTNNRSVGDRGVGRVLSQCKRLVDLWLTGTGVTAKSLIIGGSASSSSSRISTIGKLHCLVVGRELATPEVEKVMTRCEFSRGDACNKCSCGGSCFRNIDDYADVIFVSASRPKREKLRCYRCGCPA